MYEYKKPPTKNSVLLPTRSRRIKGLFIGASRMPYANQFGRCFSTIHYITVSMDVCLVFGTLEEGYTELTGDYRKLPKDLSAQTQVFKRDWKEAMDIC